MRRMLGGALLAGALVLSVGGASSVAARTTKKKAAAKKTTTTVKRTSPTAASQKTRLDRSFGKDGVALAPLNGNEGDRFSGITVGPDGRVYGAGYVIRSRDQSLAVARISSSGGLDRSFGDGGVASVNLAIGASSTVEQARTVAVQSTGKVVVAGAFERDLGGSGDAARDTDIGIARFNVDGSLDKTFGTNGVTKVDLAPGRNVGGTFTSDAVYGLAVTASDKIVLFGTKAAAGTGRTDSDYVILGLSAKGIVDFGFGTNGQAVADVNRSIDVARQIMVQPDGKIVATGYSRDGDGVVSPVVFRVNPDGSPDAGFGSNGVANHKILGGVAESYEVAQQGSNYILAGYGRGEDANEKVDLIVYRFTDRGQHDRSFGTNGLTRVDIADEDDRGRDVAVLPDGRILVVGSGKPSATNVNGMMVLLTANGARVADFGDNGALLTDIGGPADSWYGIALTPDKKHAIVVGYKGTDATSGGNDDAAVARVIL